MTITPIKTDIVHPNEDLFGILEKFLPPIKEKDVVVITSKILGLCEGRVKKIPEHPTYEEKDKLVIKEADFYLDSTSKQYHFLVTIKNSILAVNAGIDESNTGGYYVYWPKNLQETADKIWRWLRKKYNVHEVGVVISDSKTFPLKWGIIGTYLAHSGFLALTDKRGSKDLFGRELKMTQMNIAEGIAIATVLETGEADECTPLAIVQGVSHIIFQDHEPTKQELAGITNVIEDDAYAPVLTAVKWKKGGGGRE